jgi:hypothetical protein
MWQRSARAGSDGIRRHMPGAVERLELAVRLIGGLGTRVGV